MKVLIICLLPLFMSCMSKQNNMTEYSPSIQFDVELPDTISKNQKDILITLKITNPTSVPVTIANPAHWGNTYPSISTSRNKIPMIKVKINPQIFDETVTVKSNETFETVFDYSLEKMINLYYCKTGNYEIYFEMQGRVQAKSNIFSFFINDKQ